MLSIQKSKLVSHIVVLYHIKNINDETRKIILVVNMNI